ncbi:Malate permease [Fructilactobacillus florum 8D]|uniref:Malate permease n=1 Tax=Fructilactobacillus florum 8D TaxID=1221538 RepID=W9EM11_9LACO|nr:AEC family transporter [Fructilactobacillus florum]EKK21129.1 Malate permease [Fructilactobacillus florum 2F]ETO40719.1 Malate permease [Fructilactobacillus florum 8D]
MTAFLTSLSSVGEIVLVIALGYWLRKSGKLDDKFKGSISFIIMNIALPVSIFMSVVSHLNRDKLLSLSSGLFYVFISFVLGYVVALIFVKIFKIRKGRRGTFINMFVNANTIFIGMPLNIALFGDQGLPYFLLYYLINTISTWAVGIFFISADDPTKDKSSASGAKFNWKKLLPAPLIGFIVALVWLVLGLPITFIVQPAAFPMLGNTFTMVGGLVTPLSLIYIGIILADAGLQSIHFDRDSVLALAGRFVIAPAIMIVVLLTAKHTVGTVPTPELNTFVIQAAAPGLAVLPILVGQSHGDVDYATNLVVTSTVLFVIVVPILMEILAFL